MVDFDLLIWVHLRGPWRQKPQAECSPGQGHRRRDWREPRAPWSKAQYCSCNSNRAVQRRVPTALHPGWRRLGRNNTAGLSGSNRYRRSASRSRPQVQRPLSSRHNCGWTATRSSVVLASIPLVRGPSVHFILQYPNISTLNNTTFVTSILLAHFQDIFSPLL